MAKLCPWEPSSGLVEPLGASTGSSFTFYFKHEHLTTPVVTPLIQATIISRLTNNSSYLLSSPWVPGIVLSMFSVFDGLIKQTKNSLRPPCRTTSSGTIHIVFTGLQGLIPPGVVQGSRPYYYHLHFTDQETEAQRSYLNGPCSHCSLMALVCSKPQQSGSRGLHCFSFSSLTP